MVLKKSFPATLGLQHGHLKCPAATLESQLSALTMTCRKRVTPVLKEQVDTNETAHLLTFKSKMRAFILLSSVCEGTKNLLFHTPFTQVNAKHAVVKVTAMQTDSLNTQNHCADVRRR